MNGNIYENNWLKAKAEAIEAGLQIVEIGWEQHVILDVVNDITYRYPRHASAAAKLADEVAVLREIHKQPWMIELPVMLEHNEVFTSYRYIPGVVLSEDNLALLDQNDFNVLGLDLGSFLVQFHGLDASIVEQKQTKQSTTLFEYYHRRITGASETNVTTKAKDALLQLRNLRTDIPDVVVHGDLHGPNIVINPESKRLVGVIDLSEMETGDPHQEFRKIFMTVPEALDSAIASYADNGGSKLNKDLIVLWAHVNEWANVCYFAEQPDNPTYQRAYTHLQNWGQL